MSDRVSLQLRPKPLHVYQFADAAVEFRYRLLLNYLHRDADAEESEPPPVVHAAFGRLHDITLRIHAGVPEDRKILGHVAAARDLVDRFDREWLGPDHRTRLRSKQAALSGRGELTPSDWADIRRNPSDEWAPPTWAQVEAGMLKDSPFDIASWGDY